MEPLLTCRWCQYTCHARYRTQDGAVHSGYPRLLSHVATWHQSEYREAATLLDAEDSDAPLPAETCQLRLGYVPSDPTWRIRRDHPLPPRPPLP